MSYHVCRYNASTARRRSFAHIGILPTISPPTIGASPSCGLARRRAKGAVALRSLRARKQELVGMLASIEWPTSASQVGGAPTMSVGTLSHVRSEARICEVVHAFRVRRVGSGTESVTRSAVAQRVSGRAERGHASAEMQ